MKDHGTVLASGWHDKWNVRLSYFESRGRLDSFKDNRLGLMCAMSGDQEATIRGRGLQFEKGKAPRESPK